MRVRNSRRATAVALSLLVPLGLTACGDDDDTAESTDTTTAATGSPSIDITMTDYAYTVSGPLTAGGTMKIANKGKEFHMMGVGKLKPGKTLAEVQAALQKEGEAQGGPSTSQGPTTSQATTTSAATSTSEGEGGGEGGNPLAEFTEDTGLPGNFMGPGQAADLTVPSLKAGTYAMICFLPTEGGGPPHFAQGMISQFEVVEGTAPPLPTADATYKLAPGKAIEGPTTLTPGRHTLKFEAAPGSEQLEPGLAKLNPGATFDEVDAAFEKLFGSEDSQDGPPPPKGAASQVPAQVIFGAFDLHQDTTFYLATNFTAGEYGINAADTDVKDPPKPPKEIIMIKVA